MDKLDELLSSSHENDALCQEAVGDILAYLRESPSSTAAVVDHVIVAARGLNDPSPQVKHNYCGFVKGLLYKVPFFQDSASRLHDWLDILISWLPSPDVENVLVDLLEIVDSSSLVRKIPLLIRSVDSLDAVSALLAIPGWALTESDHQRVLRLLREELHSDFEYACAFIRHLKLHTIDLRAVSSTVLEKLPGHERSVDCIATASRLVLLRVPEASTLFSFILECFSLLKDDYDPSQADDSKQPDDSDDVMDNAEDDKSDDGSLDSALEGGSDDDLLHCLTKWIHRILFAEDIVSLIHFDSLSRTYHVALGFSSLYGSASRSVQSECGLVAAGVMKCAGPRFLTSVAPSFVTEDLSVFDGAQLFATFLEHVDSSDDAINWVMTLIQPRLIARSTKLRVVRSLLVSLKSIVRVIGDRFHAFLDPLLPRLSVLSRGTALSECGVEVIQLTVGLVTHVRSLTDAQLHDILDLWRYVLSMDTELDESEPESESESIEEDLEDDGDSDAEMNSADEDDMIDVVPEVQIALMNELTGSEILGLLNARFVPSTTFVEFLYKLLLCEVAKEAVFETDTFLRYAQIPLLIDVVCKCSMCIMDMEPVQVVACICASGCHAIESRDWDWDAACLKGLIAILSIPVFSSSVAVKAQVTDNRFLSPSVSGEPDGVAVMRSNVMDIVRRLSQSSA